MRTVVTPRWLLHVRRSLMLLAGPAAAIPAYGHTRHFDTPDHARADELDGADR